MLKHFVSCLSLILLGFVAAATANPRDYPEFAQHKVNDDIPIQFVTAETVQLNLENASRQLIIDVRNQSSFQKKHLPGARSIPLRTLPERVAEVPRDIPVVLY